jgi:hypothetical protein
MTGNPLAIKSKRKPTIASCRMNLNPATNHYITLRDWATWIVTLAVILSLSQ